MDILTTGKPMVYPMDKNIMPLVATVAWRMLGTSTESRAWQGRIAWFFTNGGTPKTAGCWLVYFMENPVKMDEVMGSPISGKPLKWSFLKLYEKSGI